MKNFLNVDQVLVAQRAFNDGRFIDYMTATDSERQALTKDYVLHLLEETHEVLRHVDWKMHKRELKEVDVFEVATELVDILKFWGNLAAVWNISPELLTELFHKKTAIVEGRFKVAQMYPATGPKVYLLWSAFEKMNDQDMRDLAQMLDEVDGELAIDIRGKLVTSRQMFETEYVLTGCFNLRWSFEDIIWQTMDFTGIWATQGGYFVAKTGKGYENEFRFDTMEMALACLRDYFARHMKEVLS